MLLGSSCDILSAVTIPLATNMKTRTNQAMYRSESLFINLSQSEKVSSGAMHLTSGLSCLEKQQSENLLVLLEIKQENSNLFIESDIHIGCNYDGEK